MKSSLIISFLLNCWTFHSFVLLLRLSSFGIPDKIDFQIEKLTLIKFSMFLILPMWFVLSVFSAGAANAPWTEGRAARTGTERPQEISSRERCQISCHPRVLWKRSISTIRGTVLLSLFLVLQCENLKLLQISFKFEPFSGLCYFRRCNIFIQYLVSVWFHSWRDSRHTASCCRPRWRPTPSWSLH